MAKEIEVSNWEELKTALTTNYQDTETEKITIKLTADINMKDNVLTSTIIIPEYIAPGTNYRNLIVDGDGHTISGLTTYSLTTIFHYEGSHMTLGWKNINFMNCMLQNAALIENGSGTASFSSDSIVNCRFQGVIATMNGSYYQCSFNLRLQNMNGYYNSCYMNVQPLAGLSSGGHFSNCYIKGDLGSKNFTSAGPWFPTGYNTVINANMNFVYNMSYLENKLYPFANSYNTSSEQVCLYNKDKIKISKGSSAPTSFTPTFDNNIDTTTGGVPLTDSQLKAGKYIQTNTVFPLYGNYS